MLRLIAPDGTRRENSTSPESVHAFVTDMGLLMPLAELQPLEPNGLSEGGRTLARVVLTSTRAWMTRDVEIAGEVTAEWELPAGALRVAGVAELPKACRDWGDFTLTLYAVGENGERLQKVSARINRDKAAVEFNLSLPPGARRFGAELDPGEDGPIQDRVRLSRALILLDPTITPRKP
ncbi:MAG: hypothetical protein ACOYN0_10025 [Phycisphaerales bacterium]